MRRFLVLLMITLLPLRGWAGDLMTIQTGTLSAAVQAADSMPADCPMHGHSQSAAADDGAAPEVVGGQVCNSCDLCLPMAETPALRVDVVAFASHVLRPARGPAVLSAAAPPSVKPPIY